MVFFRLTLAPRLGLVMLSSLLTYPAIRLDDALGHETYPGFLSWWVIFHGLLFGFLVMGPFVSGRGYRALRVIVLAIASVFIYDLAIRIPGKIPLTIVGDLDDFVIAGMSGALLVAMAVRYVGAVEVRPCYWANCLIAGLLGGLIFTSTFEICSWGNCASPWLILPHVSGWTAWQSLVFLALYSGSRQAHEAQSGYGLSVR